MAPTSSFQLSKWPPALAWFTIVGDKECLAEVWSVRLKKNSKVKHPPNIHNVVVPVSFTVALSFTLKSKIQSGTLYVAYYKDIKYVKCIVFWKLKEFSFIAQVSSNCPNSKICISFIILKPFLYNVKSWAVDHTVSKFLVVLGVR